MQDQPQAQPVQYDIAFREEGVFLVLAPLGEGQVAPTALIIHDINRRGVEGIKPVDVTTRLRRGEELIRLADAQERKDADSCAYITFSRDFMSATASLLPAVGEGRRLKDDEMLAQVRAAGVQAGLDETAVRAAVAGEAYFAPVEIARGKPAVPGKDGYMSLLFDVEHTHSPRERGDGTVDYKSLNLFSSVSQGDVVAVCVPPEEGEEGFTVKGAALATKPGKDAKLPAGKNVELSPDGMALVASVSGRVDFAHGRVEISDVYVVDGNADMGVGNVTFQGDLRVRGGVISGLTLHATGSIEVEGPVEAATLIAGRDVVLRMGMQGMDRGSIEAGGNVVSSFLERCTVTAGATVRTDSVSYSRVVGDEVVVRGRRGRVIGGVIQAEKKVVVQDIGTASGERTIVELGGAPQLRSELVELTAQAAQARTQLEKIANVQRMQAHRKEEAKNQELLDRLEQSRAQLQENWERINARVEELKALCEALTGGVVHVLGTAYQDVRITIDNATYTTRAPVEYATFKYSAGQVIFTACEAR